MQKGSLITNGIRKCSFLKRGSLGVSGLALFAVRGRWCPARIPWPAPGNSIPTSWRPRRRGERPGRAPSPPPPPNRNEGKQSPKLGWKGRFGGGGGGAYKHQVLDALTRTTYGSEVVIQLRAALESTPAKPPYTFLVVRVQPINPQAA